MGVHGADVVCCCCGHGGLCAGGVYVVLAEEQDLADEALVVDVVRLIEQQVAEKEQNEEVRASCHRSSLPVPSGGIGLPGRCAQRDHPHCRDASYSLSGGMGR